jgi:hypothetical protein
MNRVFPTVLSAFALLCALAPVCAQCCPELPGRDLTASFGPGLTARLVVVEYFTASKNADAKRAASLVDYEEWAKELGLDEERAKEWALNHRMSLVDDYQRQKAIGSTKEFKIIKATVLDKRAVFEVTQDRTTGVYRWQVKLVLKRGGWAITGFRLVGVER